VAEPQHVAPAPTGSAPTVGLQLQGLRLRRLRLRQLQFQRIPELHYCGGAATRCDSGFNLMFNIGGYKKFHTLHQFLTFPLHSFDSVKV
jgi:hypothetical protein